MILICIGCIGCIVISVGCVGLLFACLRGTSEADDKRESKN